MPYADASQLIADYIPGATKTSEIAAITRILENASRFIDSYCRRPENYFAPNDEETIIRLRRSGTNILRVPVHQGEVVSVAWRNNVIPADSYYESKKGWLYLEDDYFNSENSFADEWLNDCVWYESAVYRVTAKFGYAETPRLIQEAARTLTVSLFETVRGVLGQISPVGFAFKPDLVPKDVLLMLENYKKREFEI